MLELLVSLRTFCADIATSNSDLLLTGEQWTELENIVESLRPAKVAMKEPQNQHLSLGNFFGISLWCKIETNQVDTILTESLVSMKTRQRMLFQNDVFRACIFLDARFSVMLSEEDKTAAKAHLVRTWIGLKRLQQGQCTTHEKFSDAEEEIQDEDAD